MPYNETLAERVREQLSKYETEEKNMMGGITIMLNGAMCAGIYNDDVMLRLDPEVQEEALKKKGCRRMEMKGKPMKDFLLVSGAAVGGKKELESWINLALEYNKKITK